MSGMIRGRESRDGEVPVVNEVEEEKEATVVIPATAHPAPPADPAHHQNHLGLLPLHVASASNRSDQRKRFQQGSPSELRVEVLRLSDVIHHQVCNYTINHTFVT